MFHRYWSIHICLEWLAGQWVPGIFQLLPSQCLGCGCRLLSPAFLHRSWSSNWVPQACVASTLPTEPSPQPHCHYFSMTPSLCFWPRIKSFKPEIGITLSVPIATCFGAITQCPPKMHFLGLRTAAPEKSCSGGVISGGPLSTFTQITPPNFLKSSFQIGLKWARPWL